LNTKAQGVWTVGNGIGLPKQPAQATQQGGLRQMLVSWVNIHRGDVSVGFEERFRWVWDGPVA
jgi:hypothetical protein